MNSIQDFLKGKPDTLDNRLRATLYAVEANSYEISMLHKDNKDESNWIETSMGVNTKIGELANYSLNVTFYWHIIDNQLITFYHPTSRIVDYGILEDYLYKYFGTGPDRRVCDAMNFGACISAIMDANNK